MSDRPPLDQRSRRRLARSQRANLPVDANASPASVKTSSHQIAATPTEPSTMSDCSSLDSDDDAPRAITAGVTVSTFGGELAKRARPSTSSSGNSDEQEDKRVKLTYLAVLPRPKNAETPRSRSPTKQPTPPPSHPRREECIPVIAPHTGPPISSSLPSCTHNAESAMQISRSHSVQSTAQHESASWPKDSTSYAGLASPTQHDVPMPPVSPQSSTSYAATAAMPTSSRRSPPPTVPPRSPQPTPNDPSQPAPRSAYPPLVVESLPNWTRHFQALSQVLGHAPNARPLGRGVRFLPKSTDEFRAVQRYLTEAAAADSNISWYCYSPATEVPTKVAIRGLPLETPIEEVVTALRELGFPAEAARAIPPPRGKHGCTYYVRLAHLNQDELRVLYTTTELLCMPQITIEAWRGGSKPPQCFRCQAYNHSSVRCFRPIRCVRCAGEHAVQDCQRSREEPPTCANCGQGHAANDRRCAHYRREARRRGILQPPPPPRAPTRHQQQQPSAPTAPMQSNAPTIAPTRGTAWSHTAAAHTSTTPAPTHTGTLPAATASPPIVAARVLPTTCALAPTEATRGPTTLVADANPPTERGRAVRGRRRRNRAPRPGRLEPAAASTPRQREARTASAYANPATSDTTQAAANTDTPTGQTELIQTQRFPPQTGQAPAPRTARSTATSRFPTPPNQASPNAPPAERPQGETLTNPDIMAIVRVIMEALMTGLTAYLQGQGAIPAITAGMAVLTRLHSS